MMSSLPQLQYLYNCASNQTINTTFYIRPQNGIARSSINDGQVIALFVYHQLLFWTFYFHLDTYIIKKLANYISYAHTFV